MAAVIKVEQLTKQFGRLTAVDGLSFQVKQGEIFGLLGPNGAGKTTTLEILEGIQTPSGGSVTVLGKNPVTDPNAVKRRIGIQLQSSSYFDHLTLAELLRLFGSFFDRSVAPLELLSLVGLQDKRDAFVSQLSGGQQHRFSIVAALVNDPDIVFLDEPTTGLDPQARRQLWEVVETIRRQGKTVVLTTHYMDEAQRLADRLAIVDHGRIIAEGTPQQLIAKLPFQFRIVFRSDRCLGEALDAIADVVEATHEINPVTHQHVCSIAVRKVQAALEQVITILHAQHRDFENLEVVPSNLEDVFIQLTGKELRE